MSLPIIPMPVETATVAGVPVSFHGLTVAQVRVLQELAENDPEATGPQTLAWAFDCDVDEAATWIETHTPGAGMQLAEHIMRASGMTSATGAQFPA